MNLSKVIFFDLDDSLISEIFYVISGIKAVEVSISNTYNVSLNG